MMEFRKFAFAAGTVLLLTVLLNGEKLDNKNKQEEDVTFVVPSTSDAVFADTFESVDVFNQQNQQFWVKSQVEKYSSQSVAVKKSTELKGVFSQEQGLTLEKPAKHYGIASKLQSPFSLKQNQEVVVQYEVKLTEGLECGGAYIKLLSDTTPALDLTTFDDQTPFTIMFGPDRCGSNNKVHFILRHQSPKTHKYEEKHLKSPPEAKIDRLSHLYTLVLRNSNHSYEIFIDQVSVANGSLFSDFEPAINPPKEIDDPNDKKPADWVDEFKIADPNAKKPDDWDESEPEKIVDESAKKPANWLDDEPLMVKDPKVMKPEDWSDDDDGEWEAPQIANPKCSSGLCGKWEKPMIHNPKYKGIWKAPLISNPRYKGEWKPRKIPNPDYFEDAHPMSNLANIGAVAIEVWTMSGGISFDNFWLGHDASKAMDFGKKTWLPKFEAEKKLLSSNIDSGKREKRELLLKSGSLSDKIQVYFMDFMDFVNLHYQASLAVAVGILTSLLALCFLCGRANLPAKDVEIAEKVETEAPGIEDDVEVDQDESRFEEIEEEEKVDEEPKSKVRQRKKKAPKAD